MIATARHDLIEWGPARHDPEHPLHLAVAGPDPLDLRDDAFERPDDN